MPSRMRPVQKNDHNGNCNQPAGAGNSDPGRRHAGRCRRSRYGDHDGGWHPVGSVLNVEITTKTETSDDGEVALTKLVTYTKTTYDADGTPIEIPVFQLGHCETDGCHRHFCCSRTPNWCSCYLLQWGTIRTASTVGSLLQHFNIQNGLVFCRSATAKISPRRQVPEQRGGQL